MRAISARPVARISKGGFTRCVVSSILVWWQPLPHCQRVRGGGGGGVTTLGVERDLRTAARVSGY